MMADLTFQKQGPIDSWRANNDGARGFLSRWDNELTPYQLWITVQPRTSIDIRKEAQHQGYTIEEWDHG